MVEEELVVVEVAPEVDLVGQEAVALSVVVEEVVEVLPEAVDSHQEVDLEVVEHREAEEDSVVQGEDEAVTRYQESLIYILYSQHDRLAQTCFRTGCETWEGYAVMIVK